MFCVRWVVQLLSWMVFVVRRLFLPAISDLGDHPPKCRQIDANYPGNTRRWPSVLLMLTHRLRSRPNIRTTLGQRIVFAGLESGIAMWLSDYVGDRKLSLSHSVSAGERVTEVEWKHNHENPWQVVILDIKGCICHFAKWQIHPFIPKGTKYLVM